MFELRKTLTGTHWIPFKKKFSNQSIVFSKNYIPTVDSR